MGARVLELFPRDPNEQRKKIRDDGGLSKAFGLYRDLYQQQFKQKPAITPADARALKVLIGEFGEEMVLARMPIYLTLEDSYLQREGYPLRSFKGSWNRINAIELQRKLDRDPSMAKTMEYIRRLRSYGESENRREEGADEKKRKS